MAPPHAAVLMMQGSRPADRDNDVLFPPIRALLERGVAAYSFDKPGVGASEGDWREHALKGRAAQAVTALEVLGKQHDVDPSRVAAEGLSFADLPELPESELPESGRGINAG